MNLNDLEPFDDRGQTPKTNADNSVLSGPIQVYFRDLPARLIARIKEADAIFGCVAWLTHPAILDAMSEKSAAIVVQKEDFLRPDLKASGNWKAELHERYSRLRCTSSRYAFRNVIGALSVGGDPTIDGVRCVGNFNRERAPASPRMHNKFLVFCKYSDAASHEDPEPIPYAVWTGSFNFSANAENSLENAVYLSEPAVVAAYFNEFAQIMALSEPLNWQEDWSAPEWRIGS